MQFDEQLHWRGSALAFPFGEGGPLAVEEVLPQYEFAEGLPTIDSAYRTSPAPFGGTLPKGEGIITTCMYTTGASLYLWVLILNDYIDIINKILPKWEENT